VVECVRCGGVIGAAEEWHLDHATDRRFYNGPAHAACNLAASRRRRKPKLTPEQAAIAWAARYEADQRRLALERTRSKPKPAIY
jgi:hypothetical protein